MIGCTQLIAILIVAAMGGFIQRVTGFGFGIFVIMFFPYIIRSHTSAAAVSTIASFVISLFNAVVYRKKVPYKKIIPLLVASLITIPITVRFSVLVSGDILKAVLGIVLIAISIYFMFFDRRIKLKPTVKNGLITGGLSGVLSGLFSTGGPPIVLFLMNALTDNVEYFASTQFFFCLTGGYTTLVRFFNGIITREVVICSAIAIVGSVVGNFVGKYVFDKLNRQKLKITVYICMILSGIVMVVDSGFMLK